MTRLLTLGLLASAPAFAQSNEPPAYEPVKAVGVSIALVDVVAYPAVEFTGEFRIDDISGFGPILGYGTRKAIDIGDMSTPPARYSGDALNVGGTYRYYLYGNLDIGMQIGGEVQWVIWMDEAVGESSLSWGPFIGGKYTFPFGLFGEAQLGVASETRIDFWEYYQDGPFTDTLGPMLNVQVGWAF